MRAILFGEKKNVQWKVSNLTQSRTYYKSVNHWMWKDAKACNPCRFLSENSFQGSSSLTSPNRYLIDLLDHEQFFLFQYCKFYSYLAFRFAIVSKSSPVQSNTRVWYVVELITVNKVPSYFVCHILDDFLAWLRGTLLSDNGDVHENVSEKQTSHHFKLFRDYLIIRPVT